MPQYLKINAIKGNVTTKGYEGCINVSSLNHLGDRNISQRAGVSHREMGIVELGHLQLQKQVDASSADLWQYFLAGKVIPELTITSCHLNNGSAQWQSKITLHNVKIAHIQEITNEKGGFENIDLAYSKMERGYRSQSGAGEWQTPKHVSFDLETIAVG